VNLPSFTFIARLQVSTQEHRTL